jgi:hypothetical protein
LDTTKARKNILQIVFLKLKKNTADLVSPISPWTDKTKVFARVPGKITSDVFNGNVLFSEASSLPNNVN